MSTQPVIFLDVDGVLNTMVSWGLRPIPRALDQACVERLSLLVEVTNACVVVSSTWRLLMTLDAIQDALSAKGFCAAADRLIDVTVRGCTTRSDEIRAWLIETYGARPDWPPFAILDDEPLDADVDGHVVPINRLIGLTDLDVHAAHRLLTLPAGQRMRES
jgi:hypothetical protein